MKKKYWIITIVVFLLVINGFYFTFNSIRKNDKKLITNNYVAVFKGETGEVVYSTYLYKKTKKKKISYTYINTKTTYKKNDDETPKEEVIKKGKIKKINEIYKIAKKNKAYSYVKFDDGHIYTIEEFKNKLR